MALGHLLYCNDDGIELVTILGLNFDLWKSQSIEIPKIGTVIKDLKVLLQM